MTNIPSLSEQTLDEAQNAEETLFEAPARAADALREEAFEACKALASLSPLQNALLEATMWDDARSVESILCEVAPDEEGAEGETLCSLLSPSFLALWFPSILEDNAEHIWKVMRSYGFDALSFYDADLRSSALEKSGQVGEPRNLGEHVLFRGTRTLFDRLLVWEPSWAQTLWRDPGTSKAAPTLPALYFKALAPGPREALLEEWCADIKIYDMEQFLPVVKRNAHVLPRSLLSLLGVLYQEALHDTLQAWKHDSVKPDASLQGKKENGRKTTPSSSRHPLARVLEALDEAGWLRSSSEETFMPLARVFVQGALSPPLSFQALRGLWTTLEAYCTLHGLPPALPSLGHLLDDWAIPSPEDLAKEKEGEHGFGFAYEASSRHLKGIAQALQVAAEAPEAHLSREQTLRLAYALCVLSHPRINGALEVRTTLGNVWSLWHTHCERLSAEGEPPLLLPNEPWLPFFTEASPQWRTPSSGKRSLGEDITQLRTWYALQSDLSHSSPVASATRRRL